MPDDRLRSLARRLRRKDDPEPSPENVGARGQDAGDPPPVETPSRRDATAQDAYEAEQRRLWRELLRMRGRGPIEPPPDHPRGSEDAALSSRAVVRDLGAMGLVRTPGAGRHP